MDKLDGKTANIIDDNIRKLQEIFPDAFTEGKVDFEMLQKLLGEHIETEKERYSFTWNGKSEAIKIALKQSTGTLRPDKESSKHWDTTKNIYIEGDNLEVLRLLQSPYRGKVKMIYIDPPYNKDKDFVYSDRWSDTIEDYKEKIDEKYKTNPDTTGRKHTNWLNMMYPRLKLAKSLLTESGVIFISIDDDEHANLKKVCDEIYGEENFVGNFIWEKKKKPSFLNKNIGKIFEYIICYTKNRDKSIAFSVEQTEEGKKTPLNNAGNTKSTLCFPPNSVTFRLPDQTIAQQDMSEGNIVTILRDDVVIKNGKNLNQFRLEGEWRYNQETLNKVISSKQEIVISRVPFRPNHIKRGGQIKKMHNALTRAHCRIKTNEDASEHITQLMGSEVFSNPKPVELIERLIEAVTYDEDECLVMDFFAGSGTFAESVFFNSLSSPTKKIHSILVQLPEELNLVNADNDKSRTVILNAKKLLEENGLPLNLSALSKERIRRAGDKILEEHKEELAKRDTPLDIGFKAFKLDTTNLSIWDAKSQDLEATLLDNVNAIKEGRTTEDVLYEVLIKYGIDLTVPIDEEELQGKKIYLIAGGYLTVCLENNLDLEFIEAVAKRKPKRVVFRDNGFADDTVKINAEMTLKKYGVEDIKVL